MGVVVFNVGTIFAAYEAIQKNRPIIDRVVTVTGKSLAEPANLKVRIGTPVSYLIEQAGGMPGDGAKVISGGPMMGKALSDLNIPVVKGTSGILIMREKEAHRVTVQPCIRCTKCVSICPMGLEPYLLMSMSQRQMTEQMEENRVMDCMECGSCSYSCPAARPLLDYIRLGKTAVGKMIRERKAV